MENKENYSIARVPKEFISAPIFASSPQKGKREVIVGNQKWIIGTEHPLSIYTEKANAIKRVFPGLDIRHGKLIFLLLSKFKAVNYNWKADIHFSMYDLCKEYFGRVDGKSYKRLADLLLDLEYTKIEIWNEKQQEGLVFNIIQNPAYRKKYRKKDAEYPELWLEYVCLNKYFVNYLIKLERMLHIRLDILFQIQTPLAAAIYTYIPSRAWHHTKNDPFEITMTHLLEQLGENVPKYKAERKRKFIREDRRYKINVINELDFKEINNQRVLRCELKETTDKKDYKLIFYTEEFSVPAKFRKGETGVLLKAWLKSGRTYQQWTEAMTALDTIEFNGYELDALEYISDWESSEVFLKMTKLLLGEEFAVTLGYIKNDILEGKHLEKPIAVLISELIEKIENSF